ncbi:MAG TPA: HAD family hydrolase [Candidatus Binatia bacterium]|nr:HAD family hydrolase [Candidatus Binatia bacterium]
MILFDIDGTLTRTQNGYLPFNDAIMKTFGFAGDIRTVVPDGNTDPLIVKDIFMKAGVEIAVEPEQWRRFTVHLQASYREHVAGGATTIQPLPGAEPLLQHLSAVMEFHASVVTGNFEATALVKLESAGLGSYLSRGAYASDSERRPDLPAIARERWEIAAGRTIAAGQCVIVGDTPKDLECARANGMKCLLVGTGRYPVEELEYWQPDACLADLSDTQEVVALLATL